MTDFIRNNEFIRNTAFTEAVTSDEMINVLKGTWNNLPFTLNFYTSLEKKDVVSIDFTLDTLWIYRDDIENGIYIDLLFKNKIVKYIEVNKNIPKYIETTSMAKINPNILINMVKKCPFFIILSECLEYLSMVISKTNKKILIKEWIDHNGQAYIPDVIAGNNPELPFIKLSSSIPDSYGQFLRPNTIDISFITAIDSSNLFFGVLVHEYQHFISFIRALIIRGNENLAGTYYNTSSDLNPNTNIVPTNQVPDALAPWDQRLEEVQAVTMELLYGKDIYNNEIYHNFFNWLIGSNRKQTLDEVLAGKITFEALLDAMFIGEANKDHLVDYIFMHNNKFNWLKSNHMRKSTDMPQTPLRIRKTAQDLIIELVRRWAIINKPILMTMLRNRMADMDRITKEFNNL